jgi:hypothetical protein
MPSRAATAPSNRPSQFGRRQVMAALAGGLRARTNKICSVDHDYLRRSRSPLIEAFRPGPEGEGAVVQIQFI